MFFRQAITVRCANVFVSGHFKPILYLCVSPYVREPLRLLSAHTYTTPRTQGQVARPWQRWELRQTAEDSCIETCVEQTGGICFARCFGIDPTVTTTLRTSIHRKTTRNLRERRTVQDNRRVLSSLFFTRPLPRAIRADFVNSAIKPTSPVFVLVNALLRPS